MSLIFIEGFDDGLAAYRWTNGAISTVNPRNGAYSMRLSSASYSAHEIAPAAMQTDEWVAGVAWQAASINANVILRFMSDAGATPHISICGGLSSTLTVRRGETNATNGTLLATAAGVTLVPGQWYYVEARVKLHDTLGTVKVWLDGVLVVNLTGQDTKNAGTKTVFDTIGVCGSGPAVFDDMYLATCDGVGVCDAIGDVVVETLVPTGDGASSQFVGSDGDSTANWQLVDDAGTAVSAADYVESNTSGNADSYAMTDLSRASGTIYGVQVSAWANKTDSGSRGLKPTVRRSGTTYDGTEVALAGSYDVIESLWETDPSTSAAWTVAGVNAMEAGVKVGT